MGLGGQRHSQAALPTEKKPGTHCTGTWLGPRACQDECAKSHINGIRSTDRPARSQSLYQLRHLSPQIGCYVHIG